MMRKFVIDFLVNKLQIRPCSAFPLFVNVTFDAITIAVIVNYVCLVVCNCFCLLRYFFAAKY